jgi:prepilin-type N-terminal cleavage/methylation domain-containing protein
MNRRGVTLVELLVALTVAGLTAAMGYAAVASLLDHRTRAREAVDAVTRAAAMRAQLLDWIEGGALYLPEQPSLGAAATDVSGEQDDEVRVLTAAATRLGAYETIVRVVVDRDTATGTSRGLIAELSPLDGSGAVRTVIEPSVAALRVHVLDRATGRWLPLWEAGGGGPSSVRLPLEPAPDDTLPPLLRLPLVVPLGVS